MIGIQSPTPEGFVIDEVPASGGWTIVREIGKLDCIVWEYRVKEVQTGEVTLQETDADPAQLLARIVELEATCARLRGEDATSIDLPQHKWNLKRAKRRFRRWFSSQDRVALEASPDLRPLVDSILAESPDQPAEPSDGLEFVSEAYATGDIGVLEDYVRRKFDRPPLIVSRVPDDIASLLTEAREAYRLGIFRGVAALCRATLESVLRRIVAVGLDPDVAAPIDRDDLHILIDSIPDRLLNRSGRSFAHQIRSSANNVLHEGVELSEDDAWRLLVLTARIVQALFERSKSLNDA